MGAKKKKGKLLGFIFLICLLVAAVYIGKLFAEYTWNNNKDNLINKYTKPIEEEKPPLDGAKGSGSASSEYVLSEDDMVTLASVVTEFVPAEHMKKTEILTNLVDPNYYSTLLKRLNSFSSTQVSVKDLNFLEISSNSVRIAVSYTSNSKTYSESITLKLINKSWKVALVGK